MTRCQWLEIHTGTQPEQTLHACQGVFIATPDAHPSVSARYASHVQQTRARAVLVSAR